AVDMLGVTLCVAGLVFTAALVSHHPDDPSLNSAGTGDVVHNLMGRGGAYLADIFLQCFGLVSMLFPLVMIAAGWRVLMRYPLSGIWSRLTAFLTGVMAAGIGFAAIPVFP